jgi:type IV pilus assembly protein PilP
MALNRVKTGVMVAALMAASTVGWTQGAPATAPPAAAPPAGTPQPAAPGAQAPPAPPAAEPYSYDPVGRRDPFISLMARGVEPVQGRKVTGLAGMLTGELMLRGILQSQGSYVALVAGPDGRTYTAHANDRLLDGIIRTVTAQGLVIMQEVNDPLSLVKQREVRKGLRAAEDGK